jgi:hypothetical protein
VSRLKEGFDYSKLDAHGLIKENAEINDRVVLIGQVSTTVENKGEYADGSKTTKKGQLGFVVVGFESAAQSHAALLGQARQVSSTIPNESLDHLGA